MLNFETAQRLANAVLAEGKRRNSSPLTVAVLDAGGHQVVLYRQDGAGFVRPQIAIGKAWGALGLGFSSRVVSRRGTSASTRLSKWFGPRTSTCPFSRWAFC
jgi:uncharacterized protein GlcG (DUF336 family)